MEAVQNQEGPEAKAAADAASATHGERPSNPRASTLQTSFASRYVFHQSLHERYLLHLNDDPFSLESFMTQHLKMGGAYWALTALWLLGKGSGAVTSADAEEAETKIPASTSESIFLKREEDLCKWIMSCQHASGGFAQGPGQDPHITSTHYALLLLVGMNKLHLVDKDRVASWVRRLRTSAGGFMGDECGECDTRFAYCGVASLTLLERLDRTVAKETMLYVLKCKNSDGGFGWIPGGESHAASVFCCLAALALCEGLGCVDKEQLAVWLIDRQVEGGGFNGRPEKAPDVCYSFWILASLCIIGYLDWVDTEGLTEFILQAQDDEEGGIADRPGDVSDVFHTYFGIAALSLMQTVPGIGKVHPVLSLPCDVVQRAGLPLCVVWE
ncbi:putative Rab geranylgeranyl transferase type II beta subunit [Besnoitia besnoiti]|uniref:Geranylgeranyl transferase type-2 subunit beta n=1 Tax=Besnoitia besnoiti TaxID=94643 RepID=A0A2A9M6P7_BESBE|nr:putative Rab geranylgeranyl transferase type II beta subunit [Besnoitia besnoiti]PFH33629.1 putative Rab geranylgeranyl transferase type II beta subunit [Besnoitia besnoiti]